MDLDKKKMSQMAREMLLLEKQKASGKLSDAEMERWAELAFALFERTDKRRSFRLPAGQQAEMEIGSTKHDIMITEASLIGLSIVGNKFPNLASGAQVFLTIQPSAKKSPKSVRLSFSVVSIHSEMDGTHGSIGLQLDKNSSEQERQDYYNLIYFPVYISYLEALAAG